MAKKKRKIALTQHLSKLKKIPNYISYIPRYSVARPSFKIKRILTEGEEFEIMKLVLDKFLWLGTGLFGWGLYVAITETFDASLYFILSGIVFMFLFSWIIVKEFEHRR